MLEITFFQHFAFVANHLHNVYGIVSTVIRTIVIDGALVPSLTGFPFQPGTMFESLAGRRIHPDFAVPDKFGNIGSMGFPFFDFFGRCRKATVGVVNAALAALIAFFHKPTCPRTLIKPHSTLALTRTQA